jgi:hypothetical protein
MLMTRIAVVVGSVLWAGSVWAQSAYVGGAIAAEVVRTSSTKSGGTTYDSGSGEAFAGAIRVGTFIAPRFGVELEYFRPGEIDSDCRRPDLPGRVGACRPCLPGSACRIFPTAPSRRSFPSRRAFAYQRPAHSSRRASRSAAASNWCIWAASDSRVSCARSSTAFRGLRLPVAPAFPITYSTRTTQYAAGPVVGVEVRAGMTEHAQLVAGLAVHTLGQSVVDGWMIRPGVGLAWTF